MDKLEQIKNTVTANGMREWTDERVGQAMREYADQRNVELMSEIEKWKEVSELGKKSIRELIKSNKKLEYLESDNAGLRERVDALEGLLNHVVYEYEQDEQSFKTILEIKEALKNG